MPFSKYNHYRFNASRWVCCRQHCRLTVWKYDSCYRRNTHQHQRLSEQKIQIFILMLKRDPVYNGLFRCLGLFRQMVLFSFSFLSSLPFSWLSHQKSIIDQPPSQLDIKQSNIYRDISYNKILEFWSQKGFDYRILLICR